MISNKYLTKIAELNNQPGPFKTAIQQGVAGIIPDIVGGSIGGKFGSKFGVKGTVVGTMAGAGLGGLSASYAVLKHHQLAAQAAQKGQSK